MPKVICRFGSVNQNNSLLEWIAFIVFCWGNRIEQPEKTRIGVEYLLSDVESWHFLLFTRNLHTSFLACLGT